MHDHLSNESPRHESSHSPSPLGPASTGWDCWLQPRIEEDGRTFYQFDMVFFEEVEDEDGNPFYEVIDSPDGSDVVELEAAT